MEFLGDSRCICVHFVSGTSRPFWNADHRDKEREKDHLIQALKVCSYPECAIKKATTPKSQLENNTTQNRSSTKTNRGLVVLPHLKGTSEALSWVFNKYGIKTCCKPTGTLQNFLVAPKDKTSKESRCGVVYHIACQGQTNKSPCKEIYIGRPGMGRGGRADRQQHT